MVKKYILQNLGCPNCAAKIEEKVAKIDGVTSASVNFMTTKITLNFDESKEKEILSNAQKIISSIEPETFIKI